MLKVKFQFTNFFPKKWSYMLRQGVAKAGDSVIVMAGVPFRTPGSTNVLHVVRIVGDELKNYEAEKAAR